MGELQLCAAHLHETSRNGRSLGDRDETLVGPTSRNNLETKTTYPWPLNGCSLVVWAQQLSCIIRTALFISASVHVSLNSNIVSLIMIIIWRGRNCRMRSLLNKIMRPTFLCTYLLFSYYIGLNTWCPLISRVDSLLGNTVVKVKLYTVKL